ncbi:nucleotidyltransferase family protein [Pedobacter agri]|uniref:nucleotidyltransferase family protein n=1 Tax=Pedobacter agri TaxID=454586 RepID=UPI0027867225|nr:nucleotidyltransferase family protein [Pedobacter agri]MDQ1142487.1 molybdenum cofactor cytidylyltransferase [Pedobacter agri]
MKTAIIILAAGNSSRMGRPKQLLQYKGQTFLDIAIQAAVQTSFSPIIVVLGAHAKEIMDGHHYARITFVLNEDWKTGMSSSIATGMNVILKDFSDTENIIITVADQVHITSDILEALYQKFKSENKNIVTAHYLQTTGTPALFNKKYFNKLLNLQGSGGAKNIIKQHLDDVSSIPFELGHIDIDTATDYHNLINHQ